MLQENAENSALVALSLDPRRAREGIQIHQQPTYAGFSGDFFSVISKASSHTHAKLY